MTYTSFCILSYVNALTILVYYFLSGTIGLKYKFLNTHLEKLLFTRFFILH